LSPPPPGAGPWRVFPSAGLIGCAVPADVLAGFLRRERQPPGVGDSDPNEIERPTARFHDLRLGNGEPGAHKPGQQPNLEAMRSQR
jgi:hypothetical protein